MSLESYHDRATCKESIEKLMHEFIPNDVTPKDFSDSLITDGTKVYVTTALQVAWNGNQLFPTVFKRYFKIIIFLLNLI